MSILLGKGHIINYAKTRDIYTDYRKAGYSKKFYEEHRAELILHKAAKANIDQLLRLEQEQEQKEKEKSQEQR